MAAETRVRLHGVPKASGDGLTREALRQLVDKDNPVILEIGCNDGSHTRWFLEEFKNPVIHCFEPDPRAIKRFKENLGENEYVTLHEIALSASNGTIQFHQSDGVPDKHRELAEGWDLSGSILEPHKHKEIVPWCKFESVIDIESRTLDTFMATVNLDTIDLVWMDVQGAEYQVLAGATNTLRKIRYIYTEYNNAELYKGQKDLLWLVKFLRDFTIKQRFKDDVLFANNALKPT
ncbi:FkbM family methyltransferase [Mucisphaera sp.]|uniref:FkbM family methyltransferase n=1 Tax=Mucisphaera sp. TaxID=2913024 RepID=UPI003D110BF7